MALIYPDAHLSPAKIDVVRQLVGGRPWAHDVDVAGLAPVGAFRLDDPHGEVGLEVFLVSAGDGVTLQVPLTYRGAQSPDATDGFVRTMQHSVLGERWAYDGCHDPVFVAALVTAMTGGAHEAVIEFVAGGTREPTTRVQGSGSPDVVETPAIAAVTATDDEDTTRIASGELEVVIARRIATVVVGRHTLAGTWPGRDEPVVLAALR